MLIVKALTFGFISCLDLWEKVQHGLGSMNTIVKKKFHFSSIAAFLAVFFAFSSAMADTQQYEFDVLIRGIKAGQLRYEIETKGATYGIHGILESTGLFGLLVKYHFDAQAVGKRFGNQYQPEYYKEVSDTGRRKSEKIIRYQNGIPKVTSKKPQQPHWLDPSTQVNTLDPMTAMAALLSDQSQIDLCNLILPMFDGARSVEITLSGLEKTKNGARCSGVYQRIGGFTKKEQAEGENFPFTLNYEIENNLYRVQRFDITTLRGRASFVRQ